MIKNKKNRHLKGKKEKRIMDLTFEGKNLNVIQMSGVAGIQFFGVTPYGFWY